MKKFGPIKEKMDSIEVIAQGSTYACLHDCSRKYYTGNSKNQVGCTCRAWTDAYKSVNH